MVRVSACHAEGRRFEPGRFRQFRPLVPSVYSPIYPRMHLPEHPYAKGEIMFYLQHRFGLHDSGLTAPSQKRAAMDTAMEAILRAPNFLQVVLVEKRGNLLHGTRSQLKMEKSHAGEYYPSNGNIAVASSNAMPDEIRMIQNHEGGHKLADILGVLPGVSFDEDPRWTWAVEDQLEAHRAMPEGDRRTLTKGLYKGAADLIDHVTHPAYCNEPEPQEYSETFAETIAHYSELAYGVGHQAALERLKPVYPHLVEPLAETIIPAARKRAAELLAHSRKLRQDMTKSFTEAVFKMPQAPTTVFFTTRQRKKLRDIYPVADIRNIGALAESIGVVGIARSYQQFTLSPRG